MGVIELKASEYHRGLGCLIWTVVFITGFVSFGFEVIMQAEAVIYLGSSNIAMGVVISMFILGYLTSILFGIWVDRMNNIKLCVLLFMGIELLVGIIIIFLGDILRIAPILAEILSGLPGLGVVPYYYYLLILIALLAAIVPALMGGEMPIAMKILSGMSEDAYSNIGKTTGSVFALDSMGSALGGVITAVFLLGALGKSKTSLVVGLVSLLVVVIIGTFYTLVMRRTEKCVSIPRTREASRNLRHRASGFVKTHRRKIIWLLVLVTLLSTVIVNLAPIKYGAQQDDYQGIVIYYIETPYNTIAVSQHPELELTFYQDRKIVYSEKDHFQLYEPMVHVPMMQLTSPRSVLILGGGNGGVLSEVLKHPSLEEVVVVEKDREMVDVAKCYFADIQDHPFQDPRVRLNYNYPREYLLSYFEKTTGHENVTKNASYMKFDCIFIDLMEPRTNDRGLNYTVEFYENVSRVLGDEGIVVTHTSSPIMAPETCVRINNSMAKVFGTSRLFGTDTWSSGPYLFCMGRISRAGFSADISMIENNYNNLTSSTKLYCPLNHGAYELWALSNMMLEAMENKAISTDDEPYVEII